MLFLSTLLLQSGRPAEREISLLFRSLHGENLCPIAPVSQDEICFSSSLVGAPAPPSFRTQQADAFSSTLLLQSGRPAEREISLLFRSLHGENLSPIAPDSQDEICY
jgi:hypothetical protein